MKRALGIDFGDVRIGLALSDLTKTISKPFETIKYTNLEDLSLQLKVIIEEKEVDTLVVGIPFNMSGKDTKQTVKVREFVLFIKSIISLPIHLIDERLTSKEAEKTMHILNIKTGHNKGTIDKIAASIILQEYLDS
ncbi:Holliday junction resolvase RuvX [Candidatus Marinimicrobia bacterium]|nr:Holliday junction resolvase RuvX [Candidatus Neomarinimicrobiota bacterium]